MSSAALPKEDSVCGSRVPVAPRPAVEATGERHLGAASRSVRRAFGSLDLCAIGRSCASWTRRSVALAVGSLRRLLCIEHANDAASG